MRRVPHLKRPFPMLAAAALAIVAPPALAAENIDCTLGLADDQVSDQVFAAYRADRNVGEALMAVRGEALRGCAATHQWSEDALTSSVRVLFGEIFSRGLLREMAEVPLDGVRVMETSDAFLAELAPEQRLALADGTADPVVVEALLDRLTRDGILGARELDERTGRLIGELLSARANIISYQIAFVDQ